jgi:hypothetical protein
MTQSRHHGFKFGHTGAVRVLGYRGILIANLLYLAQLEEKLAQYQPAARANDHKTIALIGQGRK